MQHANSMQYAFQNFTKYRTSNQQISFWVRHLFTVSFNASAGKGKQMLPGGVKEKCAKQDGYFNDKFQRMFEGEAHSDPIKMRRQHRMKEAQKNLGKPFLPSSGEKKPYVICYYVVVSCLFYFYK